MECNGCVRPIHNKSFGRERFPIFGGGRCLPNRLRPLKTRYSSRQVVGRFRILYAIMHYKWCIYAAEIWDLKTIFTESTSEHSKNIFHNAITQVWRITLRFFAREDGRVKNRSEEWCLVTEVKGYWAVWVGLASLRSLHSDAPWSFVNIFPSWAMTACGHCAYNEDEVGCR
jgi:hypothetical protein